jgi:hypothetical protein
MDCGNDASLDITGALTLAVWFNPEAASLSGLNRVLLGKWLGPDQRSYALVIQNQNQVANGLCDATHGLSLAISANGTSVGSDGVVCDDVAVVAGIWQHAAAVFEPGERLAVYLNGVLASEISGSQIVAAALSSSSTLTLARNSDLSYYAGALDEARVYARALSAGEIAALAAQ